MMSGGSKSLRIDWFDGTVIEESRPCLSSSFADEETIDPPTQTKTQIVEKKPIGFKRLLDISYLMSPDLIIEVSHRPGFWHLFDTELKGDFIVLIVKILARVYKDLQPGDKSKLATMLKTKIETSVFLNTLKNYLKGLPDTRINDKSYNSQFWTDVEPFYADVLDLCNGVVNFDGHKHEIIQEICDLLDITETSMFGVMKEHMEHISEELFVKLHELKIKATNICNHSKNNNTTEDQPKDPNHFKNINIFPTKEDLLGQNNLLIQPNIVNGAYPCIDHYLDLQFKLLREDYIGPLREGLNKYLENPSKRRHENIRVYPKVRLIRTYVSNNKVGHLVDIAWNERTNHRTVDMTKLSSNKQLMFGSLLLFTCDNFENILVATVLDSSVGLLSEGYVAVSFQSPVSNRILSEQYIMVESEVFFEPYHRVLKVIQDSRMDVLPMSRYIVEVQTSLQPPAYLTPETLYTIKGQESKEISFPVLDSEQWPKDTFGLDDAQLNAFKFALTKEFAVIQGPPGTGKTFIGVKIASTLLQNLSLEGTPMLVICYTNHALDQFLEGILKVTNNIVRLGSQSKSKVLEPFTLHNLRTNAKSKYSYLFAAKRKELESIYKQMTDTQSEIELCEREILSYRSIKRYLKLECSKEDPVLDWLFSHLEEKDDSEFELEDWEKFDQEKISNSMDELNVDCKIESCFSEEWALREIDSMLKSMEYVKDVARSPDDIEAMSEKCNIQISKVRRRLNCFKKYKSLPKDTKQDDCTQQTTDLYSLTPEQRWIVYYKAVDQVKEDLQTKINDLLLKHSTCTDELTEVTTLIDGDVLKSVRVVGVTTTTAARRHDLLRKLLSSIVIVEEAAEVLEAHIVASLTCHCQHLILIGDHKQLRPTAAHYKLAKDYNLEISLFERMIQNGVHARTLTTQRRMRPDFVELLVPTIYARLDCHPIVSGYQDVLGMRHNLYFFNHTFMEDSESLDSWSHKNTSEAKWCVALAKYLRSVGYKRDEITILTTYTGQASLIKQLSKGIDQLQGVKTTVVDNYQGEENRIVILSLVRSNRDNKIGFLNATNRICVALSRAKEGFYIFGNMDVLKSSSAIWRQINEKLISMQTIGETLHLRCGKHKENIMKIVRTEDFENCLSGTCLKVCEMKSRFVYV